MNRYKTELVFQTDMDEDTFDDFLANLLQTVRSEHLNETGEDVIRIGFQNLVQAVALLMVRRLQTLIVGSKLQMKSSQQHRHKLEILTESVDVEV